jgi:hypothetical protein
MTVEIYRKPSQEGKNKSKAWMANSELDLKNMDLKGRETVPWTEQNGYLS